MTNNIPKHFVASLSLIFTIAISHSAMSDWICNEEASQKRGDEILSCGIGIGPDENSARIQALDHSKTEFAKICDASADCRNHEIFAEPRRTSCEPEKNKNSVRCVRLIVFTIGKKSVPTDQVTASNGSHLRAVASKPDATIKIPTLCSEKYFQGVFSANVRMRNIASRQFEQKTLNEFFSIYCYTDGKCDGVAADIDGNLLVNVHPIASITSSPMAPGITRVQWGAFRTFLIDANGKRKQVRYVSELDDSGSLMDVTLDCPLGS